MRKILLPLLILLALLPSCSNKDKFDGFTRTVVYRQGDYGSKFYRIPAIITAKDGSLVIFTDKRKENETDLPEDIDIFCNYSTDGGLTWSEPCTIARGFGYMEGQKAEACQGHNHDGACEKKCEGQKAEGCQGHQHEGCNHQH